MEMNAIEAWEDIERTRGQEMAAEERRHLKLVQVNERVYRVFNTKTGRFHDLELGIDMIPDETCQSQQGGVV